MTAADKKLYIVHVGFYDEHPNFGVYEAHTNFFVVAATPQEAKKIVKSRPVYTDKKMHTDGIQEIEVVGGQRLKFENDNSLKGEDIIRNYSYNQLNSESPIGGTSN